MRWLPRTLEITLARHAREFPVVVLTGPRQSGKTTLLRRAFPRADYVSFEPLDVRSVASSDPRGLLASLRRPLILDEVQHAPALLSYVQEEVDAHRGSKGRFFVTGSQNLLLMERASQTLAGRASVQTLLSLSLREQTGAANEAPPWETSVRRPATRVHDGLWRHLVRGGHPELVVAPRRDAESWLSSYRRTYVERDVRTLRRVGDPLQFDLFLRALAARSANLLDLSDVSRDLGVAVNTVKAWLSVLEASWIVAVVRPWSGNLGTRLVKTPKVYFLDTGLLCHLCGYGDAAQAASGPAAGAIFETAVFGELYRHAAHRGRPPRIHFFRTATGHEVDFLVEHEGGLVPVEAKATATPVPGHAAGILRLRERLGDVVRPGFVVHAGERRGPLAAGVEALPLGSL